jgi:hypothetical protein
MKKMRLTLLVIGMSGLIWVGQALAGRIEARQMYQHKRIQQGIVSGELTRHEARSLLHEQQKIQRLKNFFGVMAGYVRKNAGVWITDWIVPAIISIDLSTTAVTDRGIGAAYLTTATAIITTDGGNPNRTC